MIKIAVLVLLIFNMDFINTKPVFEYEFEKPISGDDNTDVLNSNDIKSQVESEVQNVFKNLVKERTSRSTDLDAESKADLTTLNDIRNAVTSIDLGQILVTNAICTTIIPKFSISPLNSAIALVCYS